MQFALLVTAPPGHEQAWHALHFCEAARAVGHAVGRVFFYGDGMLHGNRLLTPPQDEPVLLPRWQALAEGGTELVVCVAAALRRGVLDADNARRFGRDGRQPRPRLPHLRTRPAAESLAAADRVVSFTS